jgi:hypothetical protein
MIPAFCPSPPSMRGCSQPLTATIKNGGSLRFLVLIATGRVRRRMRWWLPRGGRPRLHGRVRHRSAGGVRHATRVGPGLVGRMRWCRIGRMPRWGIGWMRRCRVCRMARWGIGRMWCVHIPQRMLRRRVSLVRRHTTSVGARGRGRCRSDHVFGPWPTGGMRRARRMGLPRRVPGADDAVSI